MKGVSLATWAKIALAVLPGIAALLGPRPAAAYPLPPPSRAATADAGSVELAAGRGEHDGVGGALARSASGGGHLPLRNKQLDYPGGLVRTQSYDHEGRLSERCYKYNGLSDRCYGATYDGAGNPLTMTDPEGSYTFQYDALDRLAQSTRVVSGQNDELETYDYNALGALHTNAGLALDDQRPKLAGGGSADAAVPNTYNSQAVTLDAGGRVTSLFGNTLQYNRRGRLIAITQPTVNNTTSAEYYAYDAQMRRIGRFGVVNGVPSTTDYEYYIWDGANLVGSVDNTGHVNVSWFYEGVDQPLRLTAGTLKYYYELDLAGNVRRLRRPDGTDAGGYRYSAFGNEYVHDAQAPTPAATQPLRWKARWWSDFGQLYDVRARWWSPQLGVFTSVDELRYHDARSTLWGWGNQNPIALFDPSGRDAVSTLLGLTGLGEGSGSLGVGGWGATVGAATSVAAFGVLTLAAAAIIVPTTYVIMKDLDDYWHPALTYPPIRPPQGPHTVCDVSAAPGTGGPGGGKPPVPPVSTLTGGGGPFDAGPDAPTDPLAAELASLAPGDNPGVYTVSSEAELNDVFGRLSAGGTDITPSSYNGRMVRLPNGRIVGIRATSSTGGPTIDINNGVGRPIKIHVEPWP